MTTKLRRVTISLPPEVDSAVTALASIENTPHAKIIVEYLLHMAPTMAGVAKIAKQVKAGKAADAKRTMQHTFGDSLAQMMQLGIEMGNQKK